MAHVPFGYRSVEPSTKRKLVEDVFTSVASRYDVMNDVMSLGIQRAWKQALVQAIRPRTAIRARLSVLDVATGSGDLAVRIAHAHTNSHVVACDSTMSMLTHGRATRSSADTLPLRWLVGDGESLPFANEQFDVITNAFGLRNMTDYEQSLREAYRCLRSGGQFLALELSPVRDAVLKDLYQFYAFSCLPRMGQWITGNGDAYRYLAQSIQRFAAPFDIKAALGRAGFVDCRATPYTFKAVHLYHAIKE
ncbi:MAG: ubiquinone/menaquinone biosynthesis methyltransferase [Alphaproteobacteria bacterium GM202ARS2]|nr:ubiquinone/menaquinone biosynthesis methyltransferase [Alphaproteobacteria bacterium GM202ARS2]